MGNGPLRLVYSCMRGPTWSYVYFSHAPQMVLCSCKARGALANPVQVSASSVLEAVASREAYNEEDDKDEHKDDCNECNLHLHVLPPHLGPQLPTCAVKLICLQSTSQKLTL